MTIMTTTPKIYVASLSDYNGGTLHGVWLDLGSIEDMDELWGHVNEMLAASPEFKRFPQGGPAEEWAIHDFEGFGEWRLSEYENLEHVLAVAHFADDRPEVLAFLANDDSLLEGDYDNAKDTLEDAVSESYQGCWESEKDYAYNLVQDIGLPGVGFVRAESGSAYGENEPWSKTLDEIDSLLDWDYIARVVMEDCWTAQAEDGGGIYVFRSV